MKTIFLNKTLLLLVAIFFVSLAEIKAQTFDYVGNVELGQRLKIQGEMNPESSWQRGLMSQNIFFKTTGNGVGEWTVEGSTYNDFSMMKFNNGGHIGFYTRPRNTNGNYALTHAGLENYNRMTILNNGYIGIGTPAPVSKLHINTKRDGDLDDYEGLRIISSDGNTHIPYIDGRVYLSGAELVFRTKSDERMRVKSDGKVRIGSITTPGDYKLYVEDGILTEQVKVATVNSADWADYVFDEDYDLNSTEEVETFIKENKHLPNVPSAEEVGENGVDMVEMDATLLRQIEELWLHAIDSKKEIEQLKKENEQLKKQMAEK